MEAHFTFGRERGFNFAASLVWFLAAKWHTCALEEELCTSKFSEKSKKKKGRNENSEKGTEKRKIDLPRKNWVSITKGVLSKGTAVWPGIIVSERATL